MQRVDFVVSGGAIVSSRADVVQRNRVLNMVWQHSLSDPGQPKPIMIDDDRRTFDTLLRHLDSEDVDLTNSDATELLTLLRCSHKYQCYSLASHILRELEQHCSPESVLHLYTVLEPLPELPVGADPSAPSAPPDADLTHSDPERAQFAALLLQVFHRCLQVVEGNSSEVLASDALLSLAPEQMMQVAQRDQLQARELDVGRALLRWMRHYTLGYRLDEQYRRHLVLGSLRLLIMPARDIKKLELERAGVLSRSQLEAVLQHVHHGDGPLPEELLPYRQYWLCRRSGGRSRGVLQRLVERSRGLPAGDEADSAERREAALQRRSRRADKVKMALATGAAFIFD